MLAPIALPSSARPPRRSRRRNAPRRRSRASIERFSRSVGSAKSGLRVKSPGNTSAALTTTPVSAPRIDASTDLGAGDDEIAAENQIGVARRDADRVDVLGRARELDVAEHRAALLREAGHVDHAAALAFEMRGHAEDRADRDDAGAADAGDDDRIGASRRARARSAPARTARAADRSCGLARLRAVHGDERRAEAVDAGIILVAARLVDRALAAEFGLERLDRDAIRLDAAIAAAFADEFVDDDALVGVGIFAALAPPPLLRRAGLVVDQHGAPSDRLRVPSRPRSARRAGGA